MGKVKTVVMGDIEAEEKARQKERAKRAAKKAEKKISKAQKAAEEAPSVAQVEDFSSTLPEAQEGKPLPSGTKKPVSKKASVVDKYRFPAGKKSVAARSLVDKNKTYSLSDALDLVKKTSYSKFDGTVELHLNVTDKGLRGTVALPHGTGKQTRIAIATDELIHQLTNSSINFDILIASPDMMPKLAKIAKILGPRGLMPNPKTGTISNEPEKLAKTLSSSISWKTEPEFPLIHTILGKVSLDNKKLEENYQALVKSIGKDKIASAFVKATMGPAIRVLI